MGEKVIGTRTIHCLHFWQKCLLYPVYLLIRLWNATLRLEIDPEVPKIATMEGNSMIFFWHNRLFVAEKLYHCFRRGKKVCGLVSASKDGAWLSGLFSWMGVEAVRGSSSWRGGESLKEMANKLRNGYDVVVTPDGPRGPRYRLKKGAVLLAKHEKIPVILASVTFSNYWQLNSWDKFILPKPFSKITLSCQRYDSLSDLAPNDDTLVAILEDRLGK
jgi:lysophospholipid acyltransferase (LPLAT)-like uncharacterized protein